MRSLIILEVEHGEDTDALEGFCSELATMVVVQSFGRLKPLNYTVRVDLPACFVLDSGS